MSERWDFMEKELDEEFERRDALQREADIRKSDTLNALFGARSDAPMFGIYQDSYDYLSDERRKKHNAYKKLRKLWFKIFGW